MNHRKFWIYSSKFLKEISVEASIHYKLAILLSKEVILHYQWMIFKKFLESFQTKLLLQYSIKSKLAEVIKTSKIYLKTSFLMDMMCNNWLLKSCNIMKIKHQKKFQIYIKPKFQKLQLKLISRWYKVVMKNSIFCMFWAQLVRSLVQIEKRSYKKTNFI